MCPTRLFSPKVCVVGDRKHSLFLGLAKNILFFSDQTTFLGERRKEWVALGVIAVLRRMKVFHLKLEKNCQKTFRGGPMLHLRTISTVNL